MNININKIFIYCWQLICHVLYITPRVLKYKLLSDFITTGKYNNIGPVLIKGKGNVSFGKNVNIGVLNSPYFHNSYAFIEARNTSSVIKFGNNIYINNNSCFISEGEEIVISDYVLIGTNFTVYDSDFHELNPQNRIKGIPNMASVYIKDNVFIGSNVTVLKGVTIGENTIIASGSVVTKSIPANVIAGGNPCKIIRLLEP